MNFLKRKMKKEQKGFAVTFEVLMSLLMLFMIFNMTLYTIYSLNVKDTICMLTSQSLVQASRWGGFGSEAYRVNSGTTLTIKDQLQKEFDQLGPTGTLQNAQSGLLKVNAKVVSVSPAKSITHDGQMVSITVSYDIPGSADMSNYIGIFDGSKMHRTISMSMPAIMQSGKLLG